VSKEKALEDKINLSVGSIAVMEENAVVKYLDMMLLYFRTNIHASFSIIVKVSAILYLSISIHIYISVNVASAWRIWV
jgi:hypothetical protein